MSTAKPSYLAKNKDLYARLFLRVAVDDETDQLAAGFEVEHPVLVIILPEVRGFFSLGESNPKNRRVRVANPKRHGHQLVEAAVFRRFRVLGDRGQQGEVSTRRHPHVIAVFGMESVTHCIKAWRDILPAKVRTLFRKSRYPEEGPLRDRLKAHTVLHDRLAAERRRTAPEFRNRLAVRPVDADAFGHNRGKNRLADLVLRQRIGGPYLKLSRGHGQP